MIFTKHRFAIWNALQHPYRHTLAEFSYANPALPGVTNVEGAINWVLAVLYPNTKASVADQASLPLLGNTINDYRVVQDDGDGKAAAYRWEQREGEASPSWHKVYDMDWGQDSILAAFLDQTQDLYVWKDGRTQLDAAGNPIVGVFAGQTVYGGDQANQNLTLKANSGDGVGPNTGYVQVDDNFRPAVDATYDLGTLTERFKDGFFSQSVAIDTLLLSGGSITDSSGAISFDNEDLTTTGNINGAIITASTSLVVDDGADTVTLVPGSYTDTTGAVSFGTSDLSTSGTLAAGVTTLTDNAQTLIFDPDVAGVGQITSSTGTISFDNEDLITTGSFQAGVITGTQLNIDNVRIDGNTISITNANGSLLLVANGTGVVDVQSPMTTLGQTVTGVMGITGQLNIDNLRLDGNVISSTNLNGDITFTPNGTGNVITSANFIPGADNSLDIGATALRFKDLYLGGSIGDGTDNIAMSTLLAFRAGVFRDFAQTIPAQTGDALFYDAVNGVWLASVPDSEITHNTLSGLTTGDAGHTQFVMLAGRAGGQTIQGGTAASENLILESTAHATKGDVFTKDDFLPFTNASFSGTWSGTDLGDATHYFRDLYTKGELKGARLENYTFATLPASSAQNIGRVVYATDTFKAYIDKGTSFIPLGVSKFSADQVFDGVITVLNVDVSASITDARTAIWQLRDNANNFEIMYVKIETTSASNVRITTNIPLAAGSYRLIGLE
jgi:hypothetical protein